MAKSKLPSKGTPEIARRIQQQIPSILRDLEVKERIRKNSTDMKKIKETRTANKSTKALTEVISEEFNVDGVIEKLRKSGKPIHNLKFPHINEVFSAFQEYQSKVQRTISSHKWESLKKLELEFKDRMKELGLHDHIDWTEDEEK